jgi:hypothetical protein
MRWQLSIAALLALACAPSEDEIEQEFADYVASRKACAVDDDCVLASTECPLGCGTAVAREYQSEVEQKARELVDDYESGGQSCQYGCVALVAACQAGRCEAVSQ